MRCTPIDILAERLVLATGLTVSSKDVTLIAQVEQGPVVAVAVQDDRATLAAIAAIGTAFGNILGTMQVRTTSTAFSGAAIDGYIVDKVRFCHKFYVL